MYNAQHFYKIFIQCIIDYHHFDNIQKRIDTPEANPYPESSLDHLLYHKNRIDNIQWDLEDLIRDSEIAPEKALQLKRRIDKSNQDRTDMVEKTDDVFFEKYKSITPKRDARLNTESLAWALDRLSILALKIYHMGMQTERKDTDDLHQNRCRQKLHTLQVQQEDLVRAINELMEDIAKGERVIKVYRQMKMYNDPTLNPVLYTQKNGK